MTGDAATAPKDSSPFEIDPGQELIDALTNTFPDGTDEAHPDFDAGDDTE